MVKASRIPELDLLRFVAASCVLLYHYTYRPAIGGIASESAFGALQSVTRFGYLGVTLFFIISGFVILWTAHGRAPLQFATSRFVRLYPSFWLAVLLTFGFTVALAPPARWPGYVTLLGNLSMLPGYLGMDFIDGVYWTLAVELKFYFLILVLIALRQIDRVGWWLAGWLAALTICHVTAAPGWLKSLTIFPFGSLFAGGCLLYLVHASGWTPLRAAGLGWALVLSCRAAIADAYEFMHGTTVTAVVMVVGLVAACFVVVALIASRRFKLRHAAIATSLGSLTYPLYLVHHQIGRLVFAALEPYVTPAIGVLLITALAVVISWLMAEFIERRGLRWVNRTPLLQRLMA